MGWRILADGNACRQVFENLIENAVKFCPRGSRIEVSTQLSGGNRVKIQISDNGSGFSKEDRGKMFRKYSKLSKRPTGGEPSTGLGLYIVKTLSEGMGATIKLGESEQGAKFILSFRAQKLAECESE